MAGLIDSIKYNAEQKKIRTACKKGCHTPGMQSWFDKGNYLHSYCIICNKEICLINGIWKEVIK